MIVHQSLHTRDVEKPDSILFDLDSTLYSARFGLEQKVNRRVNEYLAGYLGLSLKEAWAVRRE
jgi:putative hydrolase of the HAD superfamily